MLPKALLAAALASSSATAFLVPPTTDVQAAQNADHGSDKDVAASGGRPPKPPVFEASVVTVDCPGCGLTVYSHWNHEKDNSTTVLTDVPNFLNFFLRVERSEAGDRIVVNDLELYPEVDIHNSALHALQLPVHGPPRHHEGKYHEGKHHEEHHEEHQKEHHEHLEGEAKHHKDKQPGPHGPPPKHDLRSRLVRAPVALGYSLQMHTAGKDTDNDNDIIAMTLQIIEVDDVFVQGIPAMSIHVLRTPEGRLLFDGVDVEGDVEHNSVHPLPLDDPHGPPPPPHGAPQGPPHGPDHGMDREEFEKKLSECTNILCRWKVIIGSHVAPHRCGGKGKGKGKGKGETEGSQHDEPPHHGDHVEGHEEGHKEEHMPPHGTHHQHSWAHMLKRFIAHVVIPVMIGVAAGVLSSLAGMFVGSMIVRLWRLFFRRPQQEERQKLYPSTSSKIAAREVGAVDEKAGLMAAPESEDALPAYKDEVEEVEKQDA